MSLKTLQETILSCQKCPRLRAWCEKMAQTKRRAFLNETYWGRPVAGFGDPNAHLLIVGLAPAAHGANRTGRMFTGDNSGKWLYRALFEHGFSNLEDSENRDDGLVLQGVWITSVVHCAPPENKPATFEIKNCLAYLKEELSFLASVTTIICLGSLAWNWTHECLKEEGGGKKIPKFGHGMENKMGRYEILASYHPSQQNTFTKKLTKPMFDDIFIKAKKRGKV